MLNGVQRQLAQGLGRFVAGEHTRTLVHADEPLRCGAVDDRRFVPPAMWITVGDAMRGHQSVGVFQRFQNDGHRFPNVLAGKQGEVVGINTVALNGVQDVGVSHAVRHAGVEVIHTVSGGAVHDAGAVIGGGVVGQVHGCYTLVARVHV